MECYTFYVQLLKLLNEDKLYDRIIQRQTEDLMEFLCADYLFWVNAY